MICPHCEMEIKENKMKCIRICPYCKSILDDSQISGLHPGLDKDNKAMLLVPRDINLVKDMGAKTKQCSKRITWRDVALWPCLLVMSIYAVLAILFFLSFFFTASEGDLDLEDIIGLAFLIILHIGLLALVVWLPHFSYTKGPLQIIHDALLLPNIYYGTYSNRIVVALYSSERYIRYIEVNTACNDANIVKVKTYKNIFHKQNITHYKFQDDVCGGMYIFYTYNANQYIKLMKVPAVYTEEQIAELLPYAQKIK